MSHSTMILPRRTATTAAISSFAKRKPRTPFLCEHQIFSLAARQFTTSHRREALGQRRDLDYAAIVPKQKSQKTMMAQNSFEKSKALPDDLGRMPNCPILSSASNLPSWLPPTFRQRLRIQWFQLKQNVQGTFTLIYLQWWDAPRDPLTNKKLSKPLELSDRTQVAMDLHKQFNTALTNGDVRTLEKVACNGLLNQAKSRIQRRKRTRTDETWKLLSYIGITYPRFLQTWPISVLLPNASARVVSDRLAPLPMPNSSFRQCTVRIRSTQYYRLSNMTEGNMKNLTEYVVIQKLTLNGKESPWKMWGTVDPNTVEEVEKMIEGGKTQDTIGGRFRDQLSGFTGFNV
ncbi:hypothetical protein H2204_006595 [Knufia peltigerae]|nr:hypothetical protein H2204_006595 [Knufia peltigerae]